MSSWTGADALAALGFIMPIYMVIIGIGQGLGTGTTSFIARSIWGGKQE